MPKTTYYANKSLDHLLGGPDFARPGTVYISLFSTAPTIAGGGTEFTGGAYARIAVVNNATNFPAAASGAKSIGVDLSFPTLTADQLDAVAFGIHDASVAGNLIAFGDITPPKECKTGDRPFFPAFTGLQFFET